ncbi:hypothetical protein UT300012_22220 [Paraclostridium bifermentans]
MVLRKRSGKLTREQQLIYKYTYLARYCNVPERILSIVPRILCHDFLESRVILKYGSHVIEAEKLPLSIKKKFSTMRRLSKDKEQDAYNRLTDLHRTYYDIFKLKSYLNSPSKFPGVLMAKSIIKSDDYLDYKFKCIYEMFMYDTKNLNDNSLDNLIRESKARVVLKDRDMGYDDLLLGFSYDLDTDEERVRMKFKLLKDIHDFKLINFSVKTKVFNEDSYAKLSVANDFIKMYLLPESYMVNLTDEQVNAYLGNKNFNIVKELKSRMEDLTKDEKWNLLRLDEAIGKFEESLVLP